jgi:Ring finger domain
MSKPTRPHIKPQSSQTTVQKTANQSAIRQAGTKPVAPPVYHPQPPPKVLQRKMVTTEPQLRPQVQPRPVAPPVYRPQPVPRVLQTKMGSAQQAVNQTKPASVAAPVSRPQSPPKVLQAKQDKTERLTSSHGGGNRPNSLSHSRPNAVAPASKVVQREKAVDSDLSQIISSLEQIAAKIRSAVDSQIKLELEKSGKKNSSPGLTGANIQAKFPFKPSRSSGVIQRAGGNNLPPYDDADCNICRGGAQGRIVQLGCFHTHTFHWACITTWLQLNPTCPICRAPVVAPQGTFMEMLYDLRARAGGQVQVIRQQAREQVQHALEIYQRPRHIMVIALVALLHNFGILDDGQFLILALGILFFGDNFIQLLLQLFQQFLGLANQAFGH